MHVALRRLLVALLALAVVGGSTVQLARAAAYGSGADGFGADGSGATEAPCDMPMAGPVADAPDGVAPDGMAPDGKATPPCKGMSLGCKQPCCVVSAAVPAPATAPVAASRSVAVRYWPAPARFAGVRRTPEPLPPRTI